MEQLRSSPARVYTIRELLPGTAARQQESADVAPLQRHHGVRGDGEALAAEIEAQQHELQQLRAELRQERTRSQSLAALVAHHAAQLSATIAAIPGGVWICDRYGQLTAISEAALTMFGITPIYVALRSIDDLPHLFTPDSSDRDVCFGLRTALSGRTANRELVLRPAHCPDRTVTVAVTATPMRDTAGTMIGAVAVVHDISDQKAMERVKDDFLSVAAHELKTPVTAIKGYAQLALMRLSSGNFELLKRALHTIDQQAGRMTHLVGELIDASRIQGGYLEYELATTDLVQLVEACVHDARLKTILHEITLVAPKRVVGVWDQQRIRQVIENLLDNAIKYSPQGGPIDVRVDVINNVASLTVRDHGIGIPPEKQSLVFDAWFQAHGDTIGDFGGMGLGLNICKEIIERHGGRMWVDSVEGDGSLFGFTLPLAA